MGCGAATYESLEGSFFAHQCLICFTAAVHVVKVPYLLALAFSINGVLDGLGNWHCQAVISSFSFSSDLRVAVASL